MENREIGASIYIEPVKRKYFLWECLERSDVTMYAEPSQVVYENSGWQSVVSKHWQCCYQYNLPGCSTKAIKIFI